jgi:phage I-like protein
MPGPAFAICDLALGSGVPDWVQLFPMGEVQSRDGRAWTLSDPQAVIRAFQAAAVDLPIDYEHAVDRPELAAGGPVRAAGWITELKADAQGLWGRVDWTATAADMIAARQYRYLSPSFDYHKDTGEIVRLRGAGLVHRPGLHLQALASEDTMPPEMTAKPATEADLLPRIAEAMGLPADTAATDVLAMIGRIMKVLARLAGKPEGGPAAELATAAMQAAPDPARYVPVETVQAMLAERNQSVATATAARAEEKVADALRRGFLSPAMKGWAMALCRSDEASFDAFLSSTLLAFASVTQSFDHLRAPPSARLATAPASPEAASIAAQLGLKPGQLAD